MSSKPSLSRNISPLGAWAFALGTTVGWGSLVVTANTYLAQAGPLGSILGLIVGAAVMIVIARNYSYMMQIYPDAGGAYTYSKEVFGYDHGFLTCWFLALTYLAILWANATSIPLFAHYFIGDIFRFGKLYTIFGYDVFTGEIIITFLAVFLTALLCMFSRKKAAGVMILLVLVFLAGITLVLFFALFKHGIGASTYSYSPAFVPDTAALGQIIKIAVISPWAFIGFESISHASEETSFAHTKIFKVFLSAVIAATLLYIFVILLSVTAYPDRYESWLAYIQDRSNLNGLEAFPAFYAAYHYLGQTGVGIMMASLFSLILTSLIANITALSRLFYALGKDKVLPEKFGKLNKIHIPANAILLVVALSMIIPFVGRTAIGWIVDITTICATLIYGFVSAAAYKTAKIRDDKTETITGAAGLIIMICFGLYILLPNLFATGSLEKETYFLFIVWTVIGFLYFRYILRVDTEKRFGSSTIVWVVLLSFVLFISIIWMKQSMISTNETMLSNIKNYYDQRGDTSHQRIEDERYIEEQMRQLEASDTRTMLVAIAMFGFALAIMITNHSYMDKRSKESETRANIDPLTGVKSKHAYLVKEKQINDSLSAQKMEPFSVVVCDVNGLKIINDTLGHKAGDEYICSASRMICEIFEHSPVYRLGGDEFTVIVTGRDYSVRNELIKLLHDRSVTHIGSGDVVVSGGMSDFVEGDDNYFHDVFKRADALMYEEKQLLKSLGAMTRDDDSDEKTKEEKALKELLHIRKHILVVDDEPVDRILLGTILEKDYDILYASDGLEALNMIREYREDLAVVLLDLRMPHMTGMELLRNKREDENISHIPVIVLTADMQAEVECLRLGAVDFITKPYPAGEVIQARIQKCIEMSENIDIIQFTERDHLTHLYNIDYFYRYAAMLDRHYEKEAMDAVVVDMDSFQRISEEYGKSVAEDILQKTGDRIRQLARKTGGIGCRNGMDTFLLYCPHRKDYDIQLKRLSDHMASEGPAGVNVNLRMGIYGNADRRLNMEQRFDRAMVAVKSAQIGQAHIVDDT